MSGGEDDVGRMEAGWNRAFWIKEQRDIISVTDEDVSHEPMTE